jgi:hypothetical protein
MLYAAHLLVVITKAVLARAYICEAGTYFGPRTLMPNIAYTYHYTIQLVHSVVPKAIQDNGR